MPDDRFPFITAEEMRFPVTHIDPARAHGLAGAFWEWLGPERVSEARPNTVGGGLRALWPHDTPGLD